MKDSVFRHYDIRGIVGSEFELNKVYELGLAIAYFFKTTKPTAQTCVIGYDGRIDSPAIAQSLIKALRESGFDVIDIGQCPTPIMYFALHHKQYDAGLMVTASHNPKEYNGIKICLDAAPVWGADLQQIKAYFKDGMVFKAPAQGTYQEETSISNAYVAWLVDHFSDLKAYDVDWVIDCGNGVTGPIVQRLCSEMDWPHATLLCATIDGSFPSHDADPVVERNMDLVKESLAAGHHACGVGFDGDGDRLGIMTRSGTLIPGDMVLGLFATELNQNATVVYDIKSSRALIDWIRSLQLVGYISPSGHSLVHSLMREKKACLGGELSGHFFFADDYFGYDDALYAFLRFMRLLRRSGKTIDQLYAELPVFKTTPEIRIPCTFQHKKRLIRDLEQYFLQRDDCCEIMMLDGIKVSMPYGWSLVRMSNTQPVISMRFESETIAGLQAIQRDVMNVLQRFFAHEELAKAFAYKSA